MGSMCGDMMSLSEENDFFLISTSENIAHFACHVQTDIFLQHIQLIALPTPPPNKTTISLWEYQVGAGSWEERWGAKMTPRLLKTGWMHAGLNTGVNC